MKVFLASLLVAAATALFADAQCRPAAVSYAAPTYAYREALATYYAPLTYQAYYSVGYAPDVAPVLEELKKQRDDFQAMLREVQALRTGPAALGVKEKPVHPGLVLLRNDCARCHGEEVAKTKGKGNVYFKDGELIDDDEAIDAMFEAIDAGRMPKDRKWGDAEKYRAVSYLARKPDRPVKEATKEKR